MRIAAVGCVLVAVACAAPAGSPSPEPTPTEMIRVPSAGLGTEARNSVVASNVATIEADLAATWRVMPLVFDSLQIPVTSRDPAGHTIGNGDLQVRRRVGGVPLRDYLNCGTTQNVPNTETYDIRLSVMAHLAAADGGATTVTTTVQGIGRPITTSGETVRCSSTGALELKLGAMVAAAVRR